MLFATSFAQIFIAIYKPNIEAISKNKLLSHQYIKNTNENIIVADSAITSRPKFLSFFMNLNIFFVVNK
jgi:hypothetical protein